MWNIFRKKATGLPVEVIDIATVAGSAVPETQLERAKQRRLRIQAALIKHAGNIDVATEVAMRRRLAVLTAQVDGGIV